MWTDNELYHYGVIGMKWGVRRYQNEDGSLTEAGKYRYKSWGTKHNERKAEEARAKGNEEKAREYERRAERSRELDRREQQYAERVKTGGNIATRLLTSDFVGGKAYQQALAMMNGQNDKGITGKKIAASLLGGNRLASTLIKAAYIRSGKKD